MIRRFAAVLLIAGFGAACDAADRGDVVEQDTIIQTVPGQDTLMIERTVTEDTLQMPDRDTVVADTARRDTVPR
jgi:hypothetical protein